MTGNVLEWASDFNNEFAPTCAEPCVDPEGVPQSAADPTYFPVRSSGYADRYVGGFIDDRWDHYWRPDIGFRCALR